MMLYRFLLHLLFPEKCVLCRRMLRMEQLDLCKPAGNRAHITGIERQSSNFLTVSLLYGTMKRTLGKACTGISSVVPGIMHRPMDGCWL